LRLFAAYLTTELQEGQLLINDIDARLYDIPSLHAAIASAFQDYSRFPVSLRENIGVGNLSRMDSEEALLQAVEDSGVKAFLQQLPNGLDTNLSTEPEAPRSSSAKTKRQEENPETSLSGGQWQRIALARCFLKVPDSSLVLLDEPSSALDVKAENALFEKIVRRFELDVACIDRLIGIARQRRQRT
jgi:ABC-type multidrug transport system fused ATPase/permease subunit